MKDSNQNAQPLDNLDEWEDDLVRRYPEEAHKAKEDFRNYEAPARDTVKEFYRINHINQTYDFVLEKKTTF